MGVQNVLHMNSGNGETSYASNSTLQKQVILKVKPILEEALKKVYGTDENARFQGPTLTIADLGCSSGPNTFLVISEIIETIHGLSRQIHCKPPELQVYLNDLPENDFNTIFKLVPSFQQKLKDNYVERGGSSTEDFVVDCFIAGVPGSFYGRLFLSKSLHFVHSSYCLHWLSKVPERLENKGNIYISRSSSPKVYETYLKQFQKDFSTFLSLRSEEMVPGAGRMVLTFIGRSSADTLCKDSCTMWDLLTKSLLDMASEGLIHEEDVDSFHMPYYTAYKDEVKDIIKTEGSFNLETIEAFETNWDPYNDKDAVKSGRNINNVIRAVTEPMLAVHFGDLFDLYDRFSKHLADQVRKEKMMVTSIIVSLSKK